MKKPKNNSIPELFFWAATEFLHEKAFSEAADKVLSIVRAFDFDEILFPALFDRLNSLSFNDRRHFIEDINRKNIQFIEAFKKANNDEQKARQERFQDRLLDYLKNQYFASERRENVIESYRLLIEIVKIMPNDIDYIAKTGRDFLELYEKKIVRYLIDNSGKLASEDLKDLSFELMARVNVWHTDFYGLVEASGHLNSRQLNRLAARHINKKPIDANATKADHPKASDDKDPHSERECPYCSKIIKKKAIRCRWCGWNLKPEKA